MIIECVECSTKYKIDDSKISPPGKMAHCSRCGKVFFVEFDGRSPYDLTQNGDSNEEKKPLPENDTSVSDSTNIDKRIQEQQADLEEIDKLDWDNISVSDLGIDEEEEEDSFDEQKDKTENENLNVFKAPQPIEIEKNPVDEFSKSPATQSEYIETEKALSDNKDFIDAEINTFQVPKRRKKQENIFLRFISLVLSVFIVIVITSTILYVLGTFGVIPKENFEKYKAIVLSHSPIKLNYNEFERYASVGNLQQNWVNTKNGYLFLIKGEVKNNHEEPISYIKLRTKFYSAGEDLYTQELFAGNTFTLREIKNSSQGELLNKLKRRAGDVDFDDIESFKGKNFDIKPGQSVPFYTFYLSKSKILGLKFKIEIIDLDILHNK